MYSSAASVINDGGFISYGGVIAALIAAVALVLSAKISKGVKPASEALEYIREAIDTIKETATAHQKLAIEQDKKLERINYALWNAGKTGLVNKVDHIIEGQSEIKTDVAILKSKVGK